MEPLVQGDHFLQDDLLLTSETNQGNKGRGV